MREVIERVRFSAPHFDVLVVDDACQDRTPAVLKELSVVTARHVCNLGYGRAIQTAIKYALRNNYDALITLDADGQHMPEQMAGLFEEFSSGDWDLLIGSRRLANRSFNPAVPRRVGMSVFSILVQLATGRKIHDTSSGMKVMRRTVFEPLTAWPFLDFHAEAIVFLLRQGYHVGEFPISVGQRTAGQSMYSFLSHIKYPLKTTLMVILGLVHARLTRRKQT